MGHVNHVRTVRMTPEQLEAQRARMRRGRQLASQPWYLEGLTTGTAMLLPEDELPSMRSRFSPAERKCYDKRLMIVNRLRKGEKPEALARENTVSVRFIRWIDGRSRA